MKLAYIVSAYKNLEQLERLVHRLGADGSDVVIHVDKKTSASAYRMLVSRLAAQRSVHFLDRHVCHYGGFGHVRATLKGIDQLLADGVDFDYAVLLTGQDYPIKPPAYIDRFFERAQGRSFMAYDRLPTRWWSPRGGLDRIEYPHVRLYGKHLRLPRRRAFPEGLVPYGGGAYWCLSRACLELVAEFLERRPDLVRFFRWVDVPDETFFQTVIMNSELSTTVVNDNLRYIDWTRGRRPAVLEAADFEQLEASPKLFARKFDTTHDAEILDLIDRHVLDAVQGSPVPPAARPA